MYCGNCGSRIETDDCGRDPSYEQNKDVETQQVKQEYEETHSHIVEDINYQMPDQQDEVDLPAVTVSTTATLSSVPTQTPIEVNDNSGDCFFRLVSVHF